MGKYYSDEEIQEARNADLIEVLRRLGVPMRRHGHGYMLVEHDSCKIKGGNRWWWNSRDIGADNTVEFFIKGPGIGDITYNFYDAVKLVRETMDMNLSEAKHRGTGSATEKKQPEPEAEKNMILPLQNFDNRRMSAYLHNRGIDYSIIYYCIKAGIIYEAEKTHNAIFVGKDFEDKPQPRYACQRGTLTDKRFAGEINDSDKRYAFRIEQNNYRVRVFESPIDALSYWSLNPGNADTLLSLGGVSLAALDEYLKHKSVTVIAACTDNDLAGKKCLEKIQEKYGDSYRVEDDRPKFVKDWNDVLLELMKEKGIER